MDKKIASIREGLTWVDRELNEQRDMEEIKNVMKKKFEERFNVSLISVSSARRKKK